MLSPQSLETLSSLSEELEKLPDVDSADTLLSVPLFYSPPQDMSEMLNETRTLKTPDMNLTLAKKEFLTKRKPNKSDINDAEKSVQILTLMSSADLGQSVVVSGGACLAFETAPGTDAMLRYLWMLKKDYPSFFSGGLLYKSPKDCQNLFIDQPVIGVNTVKGVKKAGLNGIVIRYAKVIVLEPTKVIKLANDLGIFIWSKK